MSTVVHTIQASTLKEDDRILLRDLRVLTVLRVNGNNVRYHELATDLRGELLLDPTQKVKVLCEGRCSIDQAIADLI